MRQLQVLVVDDDKINRVVLAELLGQLGHHSHCCASGIEALEFCQTTPPDLVLMDVMMPEMDGLETTRRLRARFPGHWFPILFLTGKHHQQDILAGLDAGGDDYLSKPVDFPLLSAKIQVMNRIAELQQRISENAKQLENYYLANELEQDFARHVLHSLYGEHPLPDVECWLQPAVQFSGDIICAARSPGDSIHLMLADSTGHGLAAAIACLPAANVFYAMTQKGFGIPAIAREINKKLKQQLPLGRFVAAALVSIDAKEQTVTIWNGGIPFAAFIDEQGVIQQQFESRHPPLGILRNSEFKPATEIYRWSQPGRIMVCSDGLTESRNQAGQLLDPVALAPLLAVPARERLIERLSAQVREHFGEQPQPDDVSLVLAPCCAASASSTGAEPAAAPLSQQSSWQIRLAFGPAELRDERGMTTLLGWLNQLGLNETQFGDLLLITSELYTNALDHGVLGLQSIDKHSSNGFAEYLAERQRRLAQLEHGWIHIDLSHKQGRLRLCLHDSGIGFDHRKLSLGSHASNALHGRGLGLVHKLCDSLKYSDNGSRVEVGYRLDK